MAAGDAVALAASLSAAASVSGLMWSATSSSGKHWGHLSCEAFFNIFRTGQRQKISIKCCWNLATSLNAIMLDSSCELSEFLVQIYKGYNAFYWWYITIWKRIVETDITYVFVPSRLQWAGGGPYREEGCDLQPLLAFKLPLWSQLQLAHPGRSGRGHYHQVEPLTHTHTHIHTHTHTQYTRKLSWMHLKWSVLP